jgi:hypothetical protein
MKLCLFINFLICCLSIKFVRDTYSLKIVEKIIGTKIVLPDIGDIRIYYPSVKLRPHFKNVNGVDIVNKTSYNEVTNNDGEFIMIYLQDDSLLKFNPKYFTLEERGENTNQTKIIFESDFLFNKLTNYDYLVVTFFNLHHSFVRTSKLNLYELFRNLDNEFIGYFEGNIINLIKFNEDVKSSDYQHIHTGLNYFRTFDIGIKINNEKEFGSVDVESFDDYLLKSNRRKNYNKILVSDLLDDFKTKKQDNLTQEDINYEYESINKNYIENKYNATNIEYNETSYNTDETNNTVIRNISLNNTTNNGIPKAFNENNSYSNNAVEYNLSQLQKNLVEISNKYLNLLQKSKKEIEINSIRVKTNITQSCDSHYNEKPINITNIMNQNSSSETTLPSFIKNERIKYYQGDIIIEETILLGNKNETKTTLENKLKSYLQK